VETITTKSKLNLQKLTAAALLIAIGIIIPLFMPLKLIIGDVASYTLASHVAIFMAMFISPLVAAAVVAGTTVGFFVGGFPPAVVLRAASHIVFAVLGALYLKKRPQTLKSIPKTLIFCLIVGVVHAVGEVGVVAAYYQVIGMDAFHGGAFSFWQFLLLLVGVGTVIHSTVDFYISLIILKAVNKPFKNLFIPLSFRAPTRNL
jgi:niacin transporter